MLLHLHIRNFAIVPELEQEFAPGFTAISGETGAGKSIMVDALGLLLGARSDASWVRDGAERADLTAEFAVATNPAAQHWLHEHELEDGEHCLLRRSIQATGRSRAWINGTPVPISQLAELGNLLVEVHGQNEHVQLARGKQQRALLDRTGAYEQALEAVRAAFDDWQSAATSLRELAEGAALPPSEIEFLRFQLQELDNAELEPDAIEALEREHRLLSSSGDLLRALDRCASWLEADEQGASALLQDALNALEPYAELERAIAEARAMLDEALINTREAAASLEQVSSGVDLDPARLEQVTAQLSQLGDLARKHGVDLEALAGIRETLLERVDRAAHFDEHREALESKVAAHLATWRAAAKTLSRERARHADSLAKKVRKLMHQLGMGGGEFLIRVEHDSDAEPGALGADRIDMLVSANPGMKPAPLARVASGGELSRISLALKVATADSGARTQVFDEIDTGVGGDTANAVGQLLQTVSRGGQALCVTHLAQVAVRADQQLQVIKQAARKATAVNTRVLSETERVEEIARMLGGTVSDQSRAHAREMLDAAGSTLQ
ncbi:MAG: DNA repair protein RecN [Xanthomonadales bacterium]|jgi:DNA repair protein RecN (Recombination protein N)|nr:DNA repair protein RecN [Xanthomonadales bacterium]